MPESMDILKRRLIQLKMERVALQKESDEASKKHLSQLEEQISKLEKEFSDLNEIWKMEKARLSGTQHIKEKLEKARLELEKATRAYDLAKMSELQYGVIPELEKQIHLTEQNPSVETQLVRSEVTEEEIAEVVSKWTGIPVSKMLEGEREKLLHMEDDSASTCHWTR